MEKVSFTMYWHIVQKQSFADFLQNICSKEFENSDSITAVFL